MEESLRKTLNTNPGVLIEVAKRLQAEEGKNKARAAFLPVIELRSGSGWEEKHNATTDTTYGGRVDQNKREGSLTLTQMLFDGFAAAAEFKRNDARTQSASHRVAAVSEQVALRAIESYLEVLRQQEIVELTKANEISHERTMDQIAQRVAGGFARQSDLDQIKARLALAGSNLTTANANYEVARINYKFVVGENPKTLFRPAPIGPEWLPQNAEEAYTIALTGNRLMHSAQADRAAAQAQASAARASMSPRLDLEMGKTQTFLKTTIDQPRDLGKYAMLKFKVNLFAGGADMARVAESRYQMNEAEAVLERGQRQLEQTVQMAWSAFGAAREKLANLQKHAENSRLSRDAYTKQFTLGQRTLLDLLDSENEYFTAQSNFINGQFVELFARYRVLAEMGYLLTAIGIEPRDESKADDFDYARIVPPNPAAAIPAAAVDVTPPPPPPDPAAKAKADVGLAVDSWLNAWSNKDAANYLGAYADAFKPAKGQSRDAWSKDRAQLIANQKDVTVSHSGLDIVVDGSRATVKFKLNYRAGANTTTTDRALLMISEEGEWRIFDEDAASQASKTEQGGAAVPSPSTPADPPKTSQDPAATAKIDITLAVSSWLDAWSNKDAANYIGAYADAYKPDNGQSRSIWASEKTKRLLKLTDVSVTHAGLNIEVTGERATVKFIQDYRSKTTHTATDKKLFMIREDGQWRILKELVGK